MTGPAQPNTETADPLAAALQAARSGQIAQARAIASRGLAEGAGNAIPLHAFLGMLCARAGEFDAAVTHLRAAHAGAPHDITVACNLIAVLIDAARDEEALAVASEPLVARDTSLRVARYRAFLAQKLGQFTEAVAAYRTIVAAAPEDFESWNNLGNALHGLGDHAAAVEALQRAKALHPGAAPTRINLATALESLGRTDEAEAVLRQAMADFPDDARPAAQLHALCRAQGRSADALAAIEEAVRRDPADSRLHLRLGVEYGMARRTVEAEQVLRATIERDPQGADAYLGLAIQYEHTNREEDFAPLLALARGNAIAPGALSFIAALDHRRAGRFDEALACLDAVPAEMEPVRTQHARGAVLERLGRTDEAFAAYTASNQAMIAISANPLDRARAMRTALAADCAMLTPDWRASWQPVEAPADGHRDPVFLLGFPRSGTTLLDTILMGHPRTVVMEEQPPLNLVEQELGGLAAIAGLDAAGIAAARARYFTEVAKVQPVGPNQLLIDKSPLFLYRLPLIRRLFPAARIILALRHPCDVVLSCFMANFQPNPAMANFLELTDAAAFYDLCFRYWEASRALVDLPVHTIVYEDLVADVAAQVKPLLAFLALEWDGAVLDHQATAKARGLITTASYAQVTEPIYRRAAGRWERYRAHLAPVIDQLAPWAVHFGYADPRDTQP